MVEHVQGALALIVLSERAANVRRGLVDYSKTVRCPFDAEPLERVSVHDVDVDVCRVHGTWFDAGEVRRIANAYTTPLEERSPDAGPDSRPAESGGVLVFLEVLVDSIDELS